MPINRRNLLISGASLGVASAAGLLGWELNKQETKAGFLIAGGGAAGIGIANKLQMYLRGTKITVVDLWQERAITPHYQHELKAIDSSSNLAWLTTEDRQSYEKAWDFIHIVPHMSAIPVVRQSGLGDGKVTDQTCVRCHARRLHANVTDISDAEMPKMT